MLGKPTPLKDPMMLRGLMVGKVMNNEDPDQASRVQVYIYGVHESEEEIGLPWAFPIQPLLGTMNVGVPDVDELVWIFFVNGDRNQPAYIGHIPSLGYDATTELFGFAVEDDGNYVEIMIDRVNKEIRIGSVSGYTIKLGSTDLDNLVKASVAAMLNSHVHKVIGVQPGGGTRTTQPPSGTIVGDGDITAEVEAG